MFRSLFKSRAESGVHFTWRFDAACPGMITYRMWDGGLLLLIGTCDQQWLREELNELADAYQNKLPPFDEATPARAGARE